uniref:interferon lambda-3-like n=1 Tax=Ictidomys tridecemlineatus TaxID=43179 RepID=UPI001A9F0AEC|nr:interferon lambda-3-like [Ictidomys tridecemlineatus]
MSYLILGPGASNNLSPKREPAHRPPVGVARTSPSHTCSRTCGRPRGPTRGCQEPSRSGSRLPAPAQPTAGPRPQGRHRHRLSHWLQRLQQAPEKVSGWQKTEVEQLGLATAATEPLSPQESPACLQASVTFNLLRLLVRDLKCVASGHLCV